MRPIIKAELKRNIWVVLPALFLEFFVCYGLERSNFRYTAGEYAGDMVSYHYGISGLENVLVCAAVWTLLLIFMQFNRDYLNFKQALPYTNRALILSKFITWAAVAVPAVLFYGLAVGSILKEYDFLIKAESWHFVLQERMLTGSVLALNCVAALAFAMAVYWYGVLCSAVCKNAFYGSALAVYGGIVFIAFMGLMDEIGVDAVPYTRLMELLVMYLGGKASRFAAAILVLAFSVLVNAVCIPLSLVLYGGGLSKHPLFRYDWTEKAVIVLTVIFGACFVPLSVRHDQNILPYIVIGGIIGLAGALIANTLIKRGLEK